MSEIKCYCGSSENFSTCCGAIIAGTKNAESAEQLMRSRYSAYVVVDADYLIKTTHPVHQVDYSKREIERWARNSHWQGLEILKSSLNVVEFKATFKDKKLRINVHHEVSTFENIDGQWFYVDGTFGE